MNFLRPKLGAISLLLFASTVLSGCSKSSDDSATPSSAPGSTTAAKSPKAAGGAPSLGNPVPPDGTAKK